MSGCRLYLVTPGVVDDAKAFARLLEAACAAGNVACLQVRLKDAEGTPAPDDHIRDVTRALLPVAQAHDVAVVMNDRPDLAVELGCDGVHVGQEDTPYAEVRRIVGADAIVGVTCHDSRHLAFEAAEAGADYVAFGAFFPTRTKSPKTAANLDLLRDWAAIAETPCVAIGGITVDNAAPVVEAGADFIAVSSGVWNHPDGPAAAVAAFDRLLRARADQK